MITYFIFSFCYIYNREYFTRDCFICLILR
nr:MAG TPA: hypothetical protein [Caudoviricetes sp.]